MKIKGDEFQWAEGIFGKKCYCLLQVNEIKLLTKQSKKEKESHKIALENSICWKRSTILARLSHC